MRRYGRRDRVTGIVCRMAMDISRRLAQLAYEEAQAELEAVEYQAGVKFAVESILGRLLADTSLARAAATFESFPDLPTDERLQHAIVAALGYRLAPGDDGTMVPVPFGDN